MDDPQPVSISKAQIPAKAETPLHRKVHLVLRFTPVAVVVAVVALLIHSGVLSHLSLRELRASRGMLEGYVHAHPVLSLLAYAGVYVAGVTLSLPVPLIFTLTGGFLFGPWVGGAVAAVSCSTGGAAAFLISRLTVGDALERGAGPHMRAIEEGIKQDAFFYLLTLRLIPVTPFWLVNVAAGLLSIRLSTFFIATVLGIFPASMIYAGIGSGLGRLFDSGVQPHLSALITPQIAVPLVGLALLSVLPILYHQFRARRAAVAASVAGGPGVQ
jgi:uncharacterized membrane protein YdjX (TVP38/TMEM64 family)